LRPTCPAESKVDASVRRLERTCAIGVVWLLLLLTGGGSAERPRLFDLDNRAVDPFEVPSGIRLIVLIFTSIECPISNRYAPEIRRLHEAFAGRGVLFQLIYPNPADTPAAIRGHLKAFDYPLRALRDPRQELVKLAQATVTPEAAVFDRELRMAYRGRIDDRQVDFGIERFFATKHDLADALTAALTGKPVAEPVTRAVGCLLTDFSR
jgi:hypothetical protein